jgi:hypothetical protein
MERSAIRNSRAAATARISLSLHPGYLLSALESRLFILALSFVVHGPFRTSGPPSAPIERLYPEGYLCPMQYGAAVQKLHDAGLDRRGSIVREYGCRHDHIAAIAEGD